VSRTFRNFARGVAALALLAAVAGGGAWWWFGQPLALPVSPYEFEVKAGSSLKTVARELAIAHVISGEWPLVVLARIRGVDRSIKAGAYEIATGITLQELLDRLTQGDVAQIAITIVEGVTFGELKAALAADAQITNTILALPDAALMERIGAAGQRPEGWFFPDTYFHAAGATDVAVLSRAYKLMRSRLDAAWEKRSPGLPLKNSYEALILASIIEKETGRAADRPLIGSVFANRLHAGMRLQTDPSVIYGLGARFDGNLRKRDLETDTPYNTYTRDGLPPTPIALPSQASLDAATHPPPSSYLYFVARGDGTSEFSTNLADHNRAVAKFQKGSR
jgi:peptidoglycan lytic transglycosylase G